MTKQTITSIMLVLHFTQFCHFAARLMPTADTPGSLRDNFIHMVNCVKTTKLVFNCNILPKLYLAFHHDPASSPTANPTNKAKEKRWEVLEEMIVGLTNSKNHQSVAPSFTFEESTSNQYLIITKISRKSKQFAV